jgi:16S rRNA (guanine527-N7)-methyltransferase
VTPAVATEVFGGQSESINSYVDILADRGIDWGLLGPREADRLWDRHILNSVAFQSLIPTGSTVADIGSGAGLPGIPLAILRLDLVVSLIEPLLRRATFLTEVVHELGLADRVQVIRSRAEDHHAKYDAVTSRALAPLPRLVEWCEPLRSSSGQILAIKGQSAAAEVDASAGYLRSRRLVAEVVVARAHPQAEPATIVKLTRKLSPN